MITTPLQRGQKVYWETNSGFTTAYFLSLNTMPTAPHAVKVKHNGEEIILRDFEVLTEAEKFEAEYAEEIEFLRHNEKGRGFKTRASEALKVPYSRILNIFKKAIKLGVSLDEKE